MTKGQLLALDTPSNIKKQFGVGYKLMIEPKTDQINLEQFISLKKNTIDEILFEYKSLDVIENSDSTLKKLIYQIPFARVEIMTALLKKLEDSILE